MNAGPYSSSGGQRPRAATLSEAKAIRSATYVELAAHAKVCSQCKPGRHGVVSYCDEGWELAKAYAAARADVAWHQDRIDSDYPGLF